MEQHPLSRHAVWAQRHGDGTRHHIFIMYHATSVDCAWNIIEEGKFRPSKDGMLGPGVYVSHTYKKAFNHGKRYIGYRNMVIFKVLVYVSRVRVIREEDDPWRKTWNRAYDSAWFPPEANFDMAPSGLQENCVKRPGHVDILGVCFGSKYLNWDQSVDHYDTPPAFNVEDCLRNDQAEAREPDTRRKIRDFADRVVPADDD